MKNSFYLPVLAISISLVAASDWIATALGQQPAPSNVSGQEYLKIDTERRVTFRVKAPNAKNVAVAGRAEDSGMNGNKPYLMTRDENGVWAVTTDPVRPGFHYYELIVDGWHCNDPASETYFGWGQQTSGLEVPDPALDFYAVKDGPHGEVRSHTYRSSVTGSFRRAMIYTPPQYDQKSEERYPVLYLQHGAGESERAWASQGRANLILDNLLATRRARPMIVVMENGYATKAGQVSSAGGRDAQAFGELVLQDLIPLIDSNFRTLKDPKHRAIAGLSMGGGQALQIGLGHLDFFSWIGAFSGGTRNFDPKTSFGGILSSPETVKQRVRLLWIGYGTEDGGYDSGKKFHEALNNAGVRHVWFEGPGSHEWQVWRKHLFDFAPRLFQEQ